MTTTDKRKARLQEAIRSKRAAARAGEARLPARPPERPAKLGQMQRSLWLLHKMAPDSPAYNMASAFRVEGRLQPRELQRALAEVTTRHRILRSTFRLEDGSVVQNVHQHGEIALRRREVAHGEALAAVVADARRPFDLERGPLLRLSLIRETSGQEHLLLVLHHILADERSLALLWQELATAYEGRLAKAPPKAQYDDWVYWSERQESERRRRDLDYWRRRLDPLPEELTLPLEEPGGDAGGGRGSLLIRASGPTLRGDVGQLAAAVGVTPFIVYAFAFRLLLQRYTGGQRFAFATPVSTRSHPATAEMIGYFLNPLVITAAIDEEMRLAEAVRDFGSELREMLVHASVPFQTLAEELSPPRRADRNPLFQAMFVHQQTGPAARLGSARLVPVTLDLGESKFDLTLFVNEVGDFLQFAVEYRADRFAKVWIEGLLNHYATLLEELPRGLERLTAELPMLGREERSRLEAAACGAELRTAGGDLLPRRILQQAKRAPGSLAAVSATERLSYADLVESASSIAHRLADAGVRLGDRVALFLDRSALMIAGILGSHRAGAGYVPLDPDYPVARNRLVLEDAEVAAVLTTAALRQRLPEGTWVTLEVDAPGGAAAEPRVETELTAGSVAYILYTSGSTGRPKGVVVSHDNLRASNEARLQAYARPPRRFLLVPSVAFDSSVAGIFWTLSTGGTLVIPTEREVRDPRRLAELVAREEVDALLCVPSLWGALLAAGGELLRSLELVIVAGESCPPQLVERHFRVLPRVRLFNEYGPTEATVWATVHEVARRDAERPVPIGRPIPGVRIDVLDSLGRRVPAGIPGQARIVGRTVSRGYWRRPALTAERFAAAADDARSEPAYDTGDRVAWTADGRLSFLGRDDEQIKLRGFRIEPGEIEAALLECAGVEQAAVVARGSSAGAAAGGAGDDIRLVAFVRATGSAAAAQWRRDLARRLPEHMIPSRLVRLAELPRLPNGKVDRRRLRDLELEPESRGDGYRPPAGALEEGLLSLWEGLLGRSGLEETDNFFELGGHSLLVLEMTLAIEQDFEVTLSAADVFENPTVRQLARRIEQRGGSEAAPYRHLFPLQPGGRGTPFIVAVPHFFSALLAQRFRGERPVYGLRGVSLRPEGNLGRWPTMRRLGEELVDEIRRRFPGEPCILAGYSFGATMAVEAARLMEEAGLPVRRLVLIAPMPVDIYRLGPLRLQLDALRVPVEELSVRQALRIWARGNNPLTRRPWARAWRRLGIEPWRRLLRVVGRLRLLAGLPLTRRILHADVRVDRFRLHARYRPGIVRTPTVIFNAREPETDAAATWRPYFGGPFTVHEIPDPHRDDASAGAAREVILRHLEGVGES